MSEPLLRLATLLAALFCWSACDNVGRAFDPNLGNGGAASGTFIQPMVEQGATLDGRPKVQHVFPEGSGWPGKVPIVVVFNESVNESTVAPGGAEPPSLQVRLADASTGSGGGLEPGGGLTTSPPIAARYDFLFGGRVVLIRPSADFDTTKVEKYEIVITSGLRDTDGIRFTSSAEKVIGSFTPDQDSSIEDGEILTVLPVDNTDDALREASVYTIFTKPAVQSSVTTGATGNFVVRTGGSIIDGAVSFPIAAVGFGASGQDGRIVEFKPAVTLASGSFDIVFNDTIGFGTDGQLDFNKSVPFAEFATVAPQAVTSVKIGNSPAGTTDKISASNIASVLVDIELPATTVSGDSVDVRIYGLDKDGGSSGSFNFVDLTETAPSSGSQTITVDFSGQLGTAAEPHFLEGSISLAARLSRGSTRTGYVVSSSQATDPQLDVTMPNLALPGANGAGSVIYYVDQDYLTFFGAADEDLHAVDLVLDAGPPPAPGLRTGILFGMGDGSKFMFDPISLGRRTSPLGFTLTITDLAGNIAPAINGEIVQRGVVTGSLSGGTLTIEAYDEATFAPVSGVTVLVDPGLPTTSIAGRVTGVTGSDGRAIFTGLAGPPATYSVTLIRAGYDLISLLGSPAGFASLPLRPISDDTATLDGNVTYSATQGSSVMLGCNILDDVRAEEIRTTTASPSKIPATAIRPNRPYVVTAFSGTFEPTSKTTFTNFACSVCGVNGLLKEAMQPPVAVGDDGTQAMVLLPSALAARDLAAKYSKDLSTWPGLDASDLVANPTVRVMASLFGVPGMTLVGVGYSKVATGTTYNIDGSYCLGISLSVMSLGPKFWVSTEAIDAGGNLARHRRIIDNPTLGTTFPSNALPGIPTVTAPSGASVGSPSVVYQDRVDTSSIPSGLGFHVLTATDSTGRNWRVIEQDTTTVGAEVTRQLPVMTGVSVAGLQTGSWVVFAESVLLYNIGFGTGDYVLEEMRREEVTYSRAAPKTFTVN
ncbi:MAG: hypothetical protein VX951_13415 [Planctomycetota bacterium]|nr:hypothetical protein [Planctomycetota bacterium]